MKKVFTSPDSAEVGFLKSVLEDAGIECFIRNETQVYPGAAFHPELWIMQGEDAAEAEELCKRWRRSPTPEPERWTCGACGEELENQFDACWRCGARRGETAALETPLRTREIEGEPFPGARKLFEPWLVVALAVLAFGSELYWLWNYGTDPTAGLYYPVETALWVASKESTLNDGWNLASDVRKWLRQWHEMGTSDTADYCENALRDTIAYTWRSRFPTTNIVQLRANLAVLLAESGSWQRCLKELEWLGKHDANSNFVLAVRAVYETNQNLSVSAIKDPIAVLGDTWFRDRFEARWLEATGEKTEAARVKGWLKTDAERIHSRHFALISIATVMQVSGFGALLWLVLTRTRFRIRQELTVPWPGWEGLAIFFAAWLFGIVLHELMYELPGGSTLRYYGHSLILWTPAIALLWLRYWRLDRTSLKSLFSLVPMRSRGVMLIAAGLALFMIDSVALRGLESVAYALGLSSHWAEYLNEAELYEPWPLRWIVLLNGVLWAPIGEESMFRGVLFPALRRWMPMSGAALASAVVFAATHYYSWPGFLGLTGFGFACALAAHYTGSLVPCVIAHILTNLVLVAGYSWVFGN